MIVRKPYAFLIKYFKIIHIILFVLMTYLLFQVRDIYMFFRNYILTGNYTYYNDLASYYINVPMLIVTIILITLLLLIFFLMRQKKKPIVYYLTSTIFYLITFISFIFLISFYNELMYRDYSNQIMVILRDYTMVLYYLNFYFLAISFIRGFGFNIKKFNFEKDIKELDITDEDREEIEVSLDVDYNNIFNFFRKRRRYFKYYIKENSFILIILLVITILGFTTYFAVDKLLINKTYKEDEVISIYDIDYTVKDSYLTNKDMYGNYIKDQDTYYLIVNLNILNNNDYKISLETKNYRIKIKDKYYYSKNISSSKFSDLGTLYKEQKIGENINRDYLIVFELDKEDINYKKYDLELYYNMRVINEQTIFEYKNISLTPYRFESKDLGNYNLGDKVLLNNTYLNGNSLTISNYELKDIESYTYTKCDNQVLDGKCVDYDASVSAKVGKKILKIEYSMEEDNKKIFNYLNINYQKNNKEYLIKSENIKNVTPDNYLDNTVLLEIPLTDIDNINLNFNIRGVTFKYLKSDE